KAFFYSKIYPLLVKKFDIVIFETQYPQHAIPLASSACGQHFDYILAAGGDGTLNQVLNGVVGAHHNEKEEPALGVIPLGTGNDFAKMCGIKPDALQIVRLL